MTYHAQSNKPFYVCLQCGRAALKADGGERYPGACSDNPAHRLGVGAAVFAAFRWNLAIVGRLSLVVLRAVLQPNGIGHNVGADRKSTRLNSSHLGISYAV